MTFVMTIWTLIGIFALAFMCFLFKYGVSSTAKLLNDNADAIRIIFTMVAVVYAAALYHQESVGRKISRTLDFSAKSSEKILKAALDNINDYWIKDEGCEILKAFRLGTKSNDEWADSARRHIRSQGLERSVIDVHSYYKDVVVCVDRHRCDEKSAGEIFAADIENFRLTYRKFLADWEDAYQVPIIAPLKSFRSNCLSEGYITPPDLSNTTAANQVDYECRITKP